MKTYVHIEVENGIMSYGSNVSNSEAIALLEGAKFNILRNASAPGAGRPELPPADPSRPPEAVGRNRMPGLLARRADQ